MYSKSYEKLSHSLIIILYNTTETEWQQWTKYLGSLTVYWYNSDRP